MYKAGDTVEVYRTTKCYPKFVFDIVEIHPSGYWVKSPDGRWIALWHIRKYIAPSKKI